MDLIKPPNEYIVIHNDLSVNTISHSPHVKPIEQCICIPTIEPVIKPGYRSTLTTPDGKPLFNCLLQHNPEPIYSKQKILSEMEIHAVKEKAKLMKERRSPPQISSNIPTNLQGFSPSL